MIIFIQLLALLVILVLFAACVGAVLRQGPRWKIDAASWIIIAVVTGTFLFVGCPAVYYWSKAKHEIQNNNH